MAFCRDVTATTGHRYGEIAVPIKCRSWNCDYCAPERKSQVIAMAMSGDPERHVTITIRRGQEPTPEDAAKRLAVTWREIVRRWRKKHPTKTCEYFVVMEAHKSGWPHLHILWKGAWLEWNWLKEQTTELINSPSVWVGWVSRLRSAVAYVAAYVGKAAHRFGTSKRYWYSKGYVKRPPIAAWKVFPERSRIERRNVNINQVRADWARAGHQEWHIEPSIYGWGNPWKNRPAPETFTVTRIRAGPEGFYRTPIREVRDG